MIRLRQAICEQLPQLKNACHALEVPVKKQQLQNGGRPTVEWILPSAFAQQEGELLDSMKKQRFKDAYVENVRIVPSAGRSAAKIEFQLQPQVFVEQLLQTKENALHPFVLCCGTHKTLYKSYVAANQAAEQRPEIAQQARDLFAALEGGTDRAMAKQWQQYRKYTIEDLSKVYNRLGVHFDSYEWESQYSQQQIQDVLDKLRSAGLLQPEHDGREIVVVDGRRIPVIKSDGSTLYLARDIAALLERLSRFQFSRLLYVVDNGQADHFNALFKTTAALDDRLSLEQLQHVKFGRIQGMSTRQGKAIFLKDVLDEARSIMREKRNLSATTRENYNLDDEHVCDILGVSAVLINVLKQRRQRDHEFSWQQALQVNGDTGIKLQYTHCRLHSLLDNFRDVDLDDIKPDWKHFATEPADALDLLYALARFDQSVWQSKEQLEACVLVNYLFGLCNATSRALKRLPVKQESSLERQLQRLLLFNAAKKTLRQGMELLGLRPLDQM
ncbi:GM21064 [Drosophila sechellia]|uniref:Probable arginine--tRNA ligase, mitochondrial n=1 Tax=Drosophila sechellia TaxID=7238 RepID=B4INM9_DROSE|nr:GM21064 [Drosophila sechellia]